MNRSKEIALGLIPVTMVCILFLILSWRYSDRALVDLYGFRQTQTALTAEMLKNPRNPLIAYETPVLGKPWSIPMEFPLFQLTVARISNWIPGPIEPIGKMASILGTLLTALLAALLIQQITGSSHSAALVACIILSSPLYIYWGQAFLIESWSTTFALAYLLAGSKKETSKWSIMLCILFGILCFLQKITNGIVASGMLILWAGISTAQNKKISKNIIIKTLLYVAIPLIIGVIWVKIADNIKAQNPIAEVMLTSKNISEWNYGTLKQRLSLETWQHNFKHVTTWIAPPISLIILGLLILNALRQPDKRWNCFVFLAGFAAGPLIFTNLFYVHAYYWFANGLFLYCAAATGLPTKTTKEQILSTLTVLLISKFGIQTWESKAEPILKKTPLISHVELAYTHTIAKHIPKDKILMGVGMDWDPMAAFYAKRKALLFPQKANCSSSAGQQAIANTRLENIGGVLIGGQDLSPQEIKALRKIMETLQFKTITETPFGVLYTP
jgi:hypothetical protein